MTELSFYLCVKHLFTHLIQMIQHFKESKRRYHCQHAVALVVSYSQINCPCADMITGLFKDCNSPRKILAVSRPMSEELSCRSQRAVGRRKDTHRISTASLALAQPHTTKSSQWNKPKPENKSRTVGLF